VSAKAKGKKPIIKQLGRPPLYADPAVMQARIDGYFSDCKADGVSPTICGLAYHLDMTRQGLCEYAAKGAFSDIVSRAKQRVEANVERLLLDGKSTNGPAFWLKNHAGYVERQEITGRDGAPVGVIGLPSLIDAP
jgi:hypothetical protein